MLYGVVLALHIFAACTTIAIIGGALYTMVKKFERLYRPIGISLAIVALFQIFTGIAMIILSPELSALKVGLHLLAYLGVCLFVEGLLFAKARSYAWIS